MTWIPKPKVSHPGLPRNSKGLTHRDYEGALSTLCAGCGHDSVTSAIVHAAWDLEIEPHQVAKMSGIGCSSKTPAYFLAASHGFNSVHGRMPSVTTGANLAHRGLFYLGVSGDGDTASIGLGQFVHAMRRRLNMLYIVENNGVYGLTKGQFSASSDTGSLNKKGEPNPYPAIDPALLAMQMGATFVAKSFSGDKEQLVPLIKAGMKHRGFALIDVVSPCVSFNNHEGSTMSYTYMREHDEEITAIDLVHPRDEITAQYAPGSIQDVTMHDGTTLRLRKADATYDPTDRLRSIAYYQDHHAKGEVVTGLLYVDPKSNELHDILGTTDTPLRELNVKDLCPGSSILAEINQSFR